MGKLVVPSINEIEEDLKKSMAELGVKNPAVSKDQIYDFINLQVRKSSVPVKTSEILCKIAIKRSCLRDRLRELLQEKRIFRVCTGQYIPNVVKHDSRNELKNKSLI